MVVPNAMFPYLSTYVIVTNRYFEFLHVFSNYFYLSNYFMFNLCSCYTHTNTMYIHMHTSSKMIGFHEVNF